MGVQTIPNCIVEYIIQEGNFYLDVKLQVSTGHVGAD